MPKVSLPSRCCMPPAISCICRVRHASPDAVSKMLAPLFYSFLFFLFSPHRPAYATPRWTRRCQAALAKVWRTRHSTQTQRKSRNDGNDLGTPKGRCIWQFSSPFQRCRATFLAVFVGPVGLPSLRLLSPWVSHQCVTRRGRLSILSQQTRKVNQKECSYCTQRPRHLCALRTAPSLLVSNQTPAPLRLLIH